MLETGGEIESVESWQACSAHCTANADCEGWSYFTESYSDENLRKVCRLKPSGYISGKETKNDIISAPKSCTVETQTGTVT